MGIGRKPPGVAVRRVSQPSGAWVDSYGNPASSPYRSTGDGWSTKATPKVPDGNPNPANWRLVKTAEYGKYLLVQIQYPDCTNYEGNKILVFEGLTLVQLVNQKMIDPHFFQNSTYKSPIARFEPTARGWIMAETFIRAMR